MVNQKALTLVEILVSLMILALIVTGLANTFVATKRHTVLSRTRSQTAELAKYLLAPFQGYVNQSAWNTTVPDDYNNLLRIGTSSGESFELDGISYSSTYNVSSGPSLQMRKVKVTIKWNETI